jgi:hypothetical protein
MYFAIQDRVILHFVLVTKVKGEEVFTKQEIYLFHIHFMIQSFKGFVVYLTILSVTRAIILHQIIG